MSEILFNGTYLSSKDTGIGVVAKNLISNLSSEKFKLLAPGGPSNDRSIFVPSNLSYEDGSAGHMRRLFWLQRNIARIMRQENLDIFFSPLPEAPLFKKIRSIVLAHDLIPIRYPSKPLLLAYNLSYVPIVLHQAELVLCNSEATCREMNQILRVPSKKLIPIRLGFDSTKYYPGSHKRSNFFLVLGRHNPHKNLKRLIKAFSMVSNKDYKLVFVGPFDSRYTPVLQEFASELNVANDCEWKGWIDDIDKVNLLQECRALIIPSLWEGFGLPALEAMACGTLVISSDRGALPEVVGNAGIFVDPLSSEMMASTIEEVINSNSLIHKAQEQGPLQASLFNWKRTADEIYRLIYR